MSNSEFGVLDAVTGVVGINNFKIKNTLRADIFLIKIMFALYKCCYFKKLKKRNTVNLQSNVVDGDGTLLGNVYGKFFEALDVSDSIDTGNH